MQRPVALADFVHEREVPRQLQISPKQCAAHSAPAVRGMNDEVGMQRSGVGLPEKREPTSRNADEADDTSFVLVYQWIVTWQARLIVQEDRLEPLAIPLPQLRRHRSRRQEHPVVQLGHLVDVRTGE